MLPMIVIGLLYVLLAGAAAMDLWRLRIPNLFPVAIVALFVAWIGLHGTVAGVWQNIAMFAFTLVGGTFLFSRGWLGGGDTKLLAAIALWFDFAGAAGLFLYVALGGAMLSLVFVALRRMMPAHLMETTKAAALKPRGPIPYGIAISGGAVLAILGGGINPPIVPKRPPPIDFRYTPIKPVASLPSGHLPA
jgi:prepilin peptidase CpaA